MNITELNIKEFDPTIMRQAPFIHIVGKRMTGKTYIVANLMNHQRFNKIKNKNVVDYTNNKLYTNMNNITLCNQKEVNKVIDDIIMSQKNKFDIMSDISDTNMKNEFMNSKFFANNMSSLLVLDDCFLSKGLSKNKYFCELAFNGSHYNITTFLTSVYPHNFTPEIRCNFDYVFLLAESYNVTRTRLYEQYGCIFSNEEDFLKVFDECTKDYGCMVIDNSSTLPNVEDRVFYYKVHLNDPEKIIRENTLSLDKKEEVKELENEVPTCWNIVESNQVFKWCKSFF